MGVTAKTYILSSPMTQDDVAVMESVCDSSVPQRAVTSVWSATRKSLVIRAAGTRFSKTRSPQVWWLVMKLRLEFVLLALVQVHARRSVGRSPASVSED